MGNRPANDWIEWKDKSGNTLDFVIETIGIKIFTNVTLNTRSLFPMTARKEAFTAPQRWSTIHIKLLFYLVCSIVRLSIKT